jgi:hypothetical protein
MLAEALGFVLLGAGIAEWFGLALMPQARVAIGMTLLAVQRFPQTAYVMLTVVVAST